MSSRRTNQFLNSFNPELTFVEGSFQVGASGVVAPTTGIVGRGVSQVTKTGTGQYTIQLNDSYNRFVGSNFTLLSPTSAAGSIADGSLVVGNPYQIRFASTSTNWYQLGLPGGLTPTQGMPFVATSGASNGGASGATGNGTVVAIGVTGIGRIEVLPNPNTILAPLNVNSATSGAYVDIQTLNTSSAPANPTSGTVVRFGLWLRNSSLLGTNETSTNY